MRKGSLYGFTEAIKISLQGYHYHRDLPAKESNTQMVHNSSTDTQKVHVRDRKYAC